MNGVVTFEQGVSVQYKFHVKKEKNGLHQIYVRFHLFQKGVRLKPEPLIKTGITCDPKRWEVNYIKQGKTEDRQITEDNKRLHDIKNIVMDGLSDIKRMGIKTAEGINQEIISGLKPKVTNKAPKGQKALYISRLQKQSIASVSQNYLTGKTLSISYMNKFSDVLRLTNECFGEVRSVDSYTPTDLEKFKAWMVKRDFTHNTVMTYLNKLRSLFKHAVRLKFIPESPITPNELIKKYKGSKRVVLTEEELLRIAVIPRESLSATLEKTKLIFLLLASTGMGYGELKSVQKKHFEEINGQLYLKKDRNKSGEDFEVLFSPFAARIYRRYFNWMSTVLNTDLPFEPFENLPSIEYFSRTLKEVIEISGIKKNVTTYTARHTFAVNWIRNGGCLVTLMGILGHKSLSTTQIYLNLLTEDKIKKANEVYSRSMFHQTELSI